MSFEDFETSVDRGEPINLYQFTYGAGTNAKHCYTDAEQDYPFLGRTFLATPIDRGDINSSGTTDKSSLIVEMPQTEAVPELFRVYPPSYTVGLIIWQGHVGDLAKDFKVAWSGIVLSCTREGAAKAKLTCEPLSVSMQRIGLRRSYQYMCPHVLYGNQCRANKAAATVIAPAGAVAGRYVTLGTLLTNQEHFAGGIVEWVNQNDQPEYRTILSVDTAAGKTRLLLGGTPVGLFNGTELQISKGCAHNTDACSTVHNNILNYGGQPYIPTKNPLGRSTPFL